MHRRLNVVLDLQSLFRLLCTAVLISWDLATPPIPMHLGSYTRALLVSQDRWHLFVTYTHRRVYRPNKNLIACATIRENIKPGIEKVTEAVLCAQIIFSSNMLPRKESIMKSIKFFLVDCKPGCLNTFLHQRIDEFRLLNFETTLFLQPLIWLVQIRD